ncbi:MAG: methyltransferase domain-containing protein [Gordonia sp. (in: high G+C Gram-positive bacteria)]
MANESMREMWTECGSGWVENAAMFDRVFAPVTAVLVETARLGPGHRALDVGCGTGTLLAEAVAAGAQATGIDISPTMTEAAAERVPESAVVLADAQDADLAALPGAPFDRVISRFGTMFFDDPTAAFRSIRTACSSDAELTFACWRSARENPTFTMGMGPLLARLTTPPPKPAAGTPGPVAFADPEHVRHILDDSGWTGITIEPFDFEFVHGVDDDGVEERLKLILSTFTPAGTPASAELRGTLNDDEWASFLDEVRAEIRTYVVDGHVRHAGACWLVTARA